MCWNLYRLMCIIVLTWHFFPDSPLFLFCCNKIYLIVGLWKLQPFGYYGKTFWINDVWSCIHWGRYVTTVENSGMDSWWLQQGTERPHYWGPTQNTFFVISICCPRQPNGLQGGGSESGTKIISQIRPFPVYREIWEMYISVTFPGGKCHRYIHHGCLSRVTCPSDGPLG